MIIAIIKTFKYRLETKELLVSLPDVIGVFGMISKRAYKSALYSWYHEMCRPLSRCR